MTARISQSQLESYLWGAAVLLRGTIDAGDYKQFIFPLLFYKRVCDVYDEETVLALAESEGDEDYAQFPEHHRFQIPREAHWRAVRQVARDVGGALQAALRSIEIANPDKLLGIFGDAQWTNKDRLPDALLRDLIEHFSTLELTLANLPEDELGQGYEYLIKQFADDSGHTAAEFYTNRTVVHLMTALLQPQPGESVYDPTCGSGGMLLSCVAHLRDHGQEWRNVRLYGQERNLMTSSIARMNCFLHGIEDFRIERGDTLAEPKFVEGDRLQRFDVVLANPPYSIKQWDRAAFASDPWGRNLYGTPPQGRADYAFQQHIICSLSEEGRCAVLWPHGLLSRQDEAEIRQKMVKTDLVEAVIGLGRNLFYNSGLESCIVICRKVKAAHRRGTIQFIDAETFIHRERAQSFLSPEDIAEILALYRAGETVLGLSALVSVDDVLRNGGSLNIKRYVTPMQSAGDSGVVEIRERLDEWLDSSAEARRALGDLLGRNYEAAHIRAYNPESEIPSILGRAGWRRVRLGEVATQYTQRVNDPGSSDYDRYVGSNCIDRMDFRVRRWDSTSSVISSMKAFAPGDYLLVRRSLYGSDFRERAPRADFAGLCSSDILTIRENPAFIADGFLIAVLNSSRLWEYVVARATGSLTRRIKWRDLARFEFDLPPLEQQRRIAAVLWAVEECQVFVDGMGQKLLEVRAATVEAHFAESRVQTSWAELGQLSDVVYGITLDGHRAILSNRAPYLRVANVLRNEIDLLDVKDLGCTDDEAKKFALQQGDVLIVEGHANPDEIGRAAVWRSQRQGVLHQNHLIRARCHSGLLPEYLCLYTNSQSGRSYFRGRSKSSSGLNTINSTVVKQFMVPAPDPSEQTRLVRAVEELDSLQSAVALVRTRLREMTAALLEDVST